MIETIIVIVVLLGFAFLILFTGAVGYPSEGETDKISHKQIKGYKRKTKMGREKKGR